MIGARILREFQAVGRDLMAMGLLSLQAGNLSVRQARRVLITRTGARLDRLGPQDVVETWLDPGRPRHPRASMELPAHLAIYAAGEARAVLHAHPPAAIALSLSAQAFVPVDAEGAVLLGAVPVIRLAQTVASSAVGEQAGKLLATRPVVLVGGHGSFAAGASLEEALSRTTTLEMSARIALWARMAGGRRPR